MVEEEKQRRGTSVYHLEVIPSHMIVDYSSDSGDSDESDSSDEFDNSDESDNPDESGNSDKSDNSDDSSDSGEKGSVPPINPIIT